MKDIKLVLENGIIKEVKENKEINAVKYVYQNEDLKIEIYNKDYNKIKPLVQYLLQKNFSFETMETKILYWIVVGLFMIFWFLVMIYSKLTTIAPAPKEDKKIEKVENLNPKENSNDNRKYIEIWGNTWQNLLRQTGIHPTEGR